MVEVQVEVRQAPCISLSFHVFDPSTPEKQHWNYPTVGHLGPLYLHLFKPDRVR